MLANRAAIAQAIPHSGSMCLIDGVISYNNQSISCISSTHRDVDNPMRTGGELLVLCGVEYAAQVMALHGFFTSQAESRPRAGYLVGLRDVCCNVPRLDNLPEDLLITAEKLMGDEVRVIYQFALYAGERLILSGRATVVLDVDKVNS
jgi:predicted hotdog family 3-hydroxylacyl-ACP dehydratase